MRGAILAERERPLRAAGERKTFRLARSREVVMKGGRQLGEEIDLGFPFFFFTLQTAPSLL